MFIVLWEEGKIEQIQGAHKLLGLHIFTGHTNQISPKDIATM